MSSHVSGGVESGRLPEGGTWDELPWEWKGRGKNKPLPSQLGGTWDELPCPLTRGHGLNSHAPYWGRGNIKPLPLLSRRDSMNQFIVLTI